MRVKVMALLLALPDLATAWGPRAHGAVHDAARPVLAARPEGRFLAEPAAARRFADAGLAADLTFSLLALGKADPAYDALFHRAEFLDHMVGKARAIGGGTYIAALGFAGHLPADRVGNSASSPTARNVFRWPADRDPWGRPVGDPSSSAEVQLAGVTHRLNKFLIDLLVDAERSGGPTWQDPLDVEHLVDAIRSYEGPAALPAALRADEHQVADDVRRFRRGFRWSLKALAVVSAYLRRNPGLMSGVEGEFEGASYRPVMDESAARVVEQVGEYLVGGKPGRSPQPGHEVDLDQDVEFLQGLEQAAAQIEGRGTGEGRGEPAADDLAGLRKRVYRSFFTRILVPRVKWSSVRESVRALVP